MKVIGWQALYALARNLEKKEDWKGAATQYERILRHGQPEAKVVFRLGHAYFRMNSLSEALPYLRQAVAMDPSKADWEYRLGFVLERAKRYQEALPHYRRALELAPRHTEWHRRIDSCNREITRAEVAKLVKAKAPTWRQAEALHAAAGLHAGDGAWMERTGDTQFKMGMYAAAAESYELGTKSRGQDATLHFKTGWAALLANDEDRSEHYFAEAIRLDKKLGSKNLGIGAFFQHRGRWQQAAEFYDRTLRSGAVSPELYFRLGVAEQKSYDWSSAIDVFSQAIALWPTAGRFHWRLGLSYERIGDLERAADAYSNALVHSSGESAYWKYRLGYVLQQLGRYAEASVAYFLSRENSEPPQSDAQRKVEMLEAAFSAELRHRVSDADPSALRALARQAETVGCWSVAADAYREIADRTASFDADVYHLLGRALMAIGHNREAAEAFAETRRFKRPHGVDLSLYSKNANQLRSMCYLEHVETLPLAEDTILYESGHGASMSGNPLQICRRLVQDSRFAGYKHVWVLNSGSSPQEEFKGRKDFIFVPRDSDLYLRYLATAKHLINDNTFPPYFMRREGQRYLNTWHGTPIKTLGKDIKGGSMDHKNAARNFLHATHMIAPNKFTADCLLEKYDVAGIFDGRMAITGYPRVDATLSANGARRAELKRQLGVPEGKQVVLYAPTWRGSLADRSLDSNRLAADLKRLSAGDWHFLYRGHSMTSSQEDASVIAAHGVPPSIDTNDLLAITDVLVTDYSSIFFDFIPLKRPIIYYAYDLDSYTQERGLYFDLASMPGIVCSQIDDVIEEVAAAVVGALTIDSAAYAEATQRFCAHEDGAATERAIEFFFFEDPSFEVPNMQDDKTNVLMFQGSFMPNGITSSYLNLVSHLDAEKTNIYTVLDPVALASEEARVEKFSELPDYIRVLARVGTHLVTPEERWVIDKLNHQHSVSTAEMWDIVRRAFVREFKRVFGTASFDTAICFEGYARFWVSLFASAPEAAVEKKIAYLHNDMYREWKERFEYLESNFKMYQHFDSLVSVTESVRDENRANLAKEFGIDPDRFTYVNNLVNPTQTLEWAAQPLDVDIADWVGDCDALFVTLGRLSPEKGHKKLIQAFAQILERRPHAKLLILGHGPLHDPLNDLIRQLNLEESVFLAGRRANPFPSLKRADCFVFSSEYEGQGLAVLEALILGKPAISTNVVGPRSVLEEGYGMLVENNIQGLVTGFEAFFEGAIPNRHFEVDVYQKEALEKFTSIAL